MKKDYGTIVVKVGSSSLTHAESGGLDLIKLEVLVRELTDLRNSGHRVILVTSGAIMVGRTALGFSARPERIDEKQACADALRANKKEILIANEEDIRSGRENGMPENLLDRLMLNDERIAGMAEDLIEMIGSEFGFGGEIGISTQKLHARGPMGLPELTSYKYIVRGTGQTRG